MEILKSVEEFIANVNHKMDELNAKIDRVYENLVYQVKVADLNCLTYNEVRELLKFGQTKLDEMMAAGQLTRINVDGHPRFNIKQLAVDLDIPLVELNRKLNGDKS